MPLIHLIKYVFCAPDMLSKHQHTKPMKQDNIKALFNTYKEPTLNHRYITNTNIKPLLSKFEDMAHVEVVGQSVLNDDIYCITLGKGTKKVLLWSQMHGNESTTTKALFDFLNLCHSGNALTNAILENCTLCILPILNPDGAKAYTRVNANAVDLNRDAQDLTQPESKVLRAVFNRFKPHYCYNLHGQRTIFSAGKTNVSATVSFLSPAQDKMCTITDTRKVAMEIIAHMRDYLETEIPKGVGVYDDAFNINCVGDTFQSENVPTILFEAGHYPDDYGREKTRALIFASYITSLHYISTATVTGDGFQPYLSIPENEKLFFDIIIRNAIIAPNDSNSVDVAIQFEERLVNSIVTFVPIVKEIKSLKGMYGHKEYDVNGAYVTDEKGAPLVLENEIAALTTKGEKLAVLMK